MDYSFAAQRFRASYFETPWHFHPEYELVLILKGQGKRFIGDKITNFSGGDLILIGPNLPHWYRCDESFYHPDSGLVAESIVLQFKENFLGDAFFSLAESVKIRKMLDKSAGGLEIYGGTKEKVAELMLDILNKQGMDRLMLMLEILNIISQSDDQFVITTKSEVSLELKDSRRLSEVYDFVMSNFDKEISMEEVAEIAKMCPSTFSRYFKKRTRKTFMIFLNEIRIGHACKLMIDKDLNISEICFKSGYNNISYFNRKFKQIKNMSPKEFRNAYVMPAPAIARAI